MGERGLGSFFFADFEQTRRDLGIPRDGGLESFPAVLREAVARLTDSPLAEGWLYGIEEIEAMLEVTPSGAPPVYMLVGSFDSGEAARSLDASGWESISSGLFRLYRTAHGSGVGVGPRRLLYSPAYPSAEATTAFRGGENSVLGLEGLQSLAVSAGRPAALAAAAPEIGCLDPRWMSVAVRYIEPQSPAVAFVVQYPDPGSAEASRRRIAPGLEKVVQETGSRIELIDARREMVVSSISTDDRGALALLDAVHGGSQLERALAC